MSCRRHRSRLWVRKTPWRRIWQPTAVFFPGKSRGQRSLEGYSPWGPREPDTTEMLSTQQTHLQGARMPMGGKKLTHSKTKSGWISFSLTCLASLKSGWLLLIIGNQVARVTNRRSLLRGELGCCS